MSKKMFPMSGVVTDIQFTLDDRLDLVEAKTTFILNGKELVLETTGAEPPLIVPCPLILAVQRQDDNSLRVKSCYIKGKEVFIYLSNGLEGIPFVLGSFVALWLCIDLIMYPQDLPIKCVLLLGCLMMVYAIYPRASPYNKAEEIVHRRLHRINQLEEKRAQINLPKTA
jgi:hypothetical protein